MGPFNTNHERHELPGQHRQILRVKVMELNFRDVPELMRCRVWVGTLPAGEIVGTRDYIVERVNPHAVNDLILITHVQTDKSWTDDAEAVHQVQWIELGGGASELFEVTVTKDGGTDGSVDPLIQASWTYTVVRGGGTIGTEVELYPHRLPGSITFAPAGSIGWAFYHEGTLWLQWVNEAPEVATCDEAAGGGGSGDDWLSMMW